MNNPNERRRVQIANQLEAFNQQCESEGIQLTTAEVAKLVDDVSSPVDFDLNYRPFPADEIIESASVGVSIATIIAFMVILVILINS